MAQGRHAHPMSDAIAARPDAAAVSDAGSLTGSPLSHDEAPHWSVDDLRPVQGRNRSASGRERPSDSRSVGGDSRPAAPQRGQGHSSVIGIASAGAGAGAGAGDEAAEALAAEAASLLEAVAEARATSSAAAAGTGAGAAGPVEAGGPGAAPRRAPGEFGPRGYALERPEGGPVGAQPVLPVPAPLWPGAHAMQREAAARLRGVVVSSGDRAGRLITWDCAACAPVSALQATSGQVTAISLDAMTGHAVATAWPSGTATQLDVLSGEAVRCLGQERVVAMAADWEAGVAVVRSSTADGRAAAGGAAPAIVFAVQSLWHSLPGRILPLAKPLLATGLTDRGRSGSPQVAIRGDTMAFLHPGEGGRAEPTLRIATVGATLAEAKAAGAAGGAGACAVM
uniref:Uncharacterized protein n=1 Tax=Cafeteria roenbergensis TaxID=33653 RepID=A0A7S0PE86_CAFRO|mmetsp:Transcript_2948/g.12020  ORF Transcript_2948/g.12020 Transcript_2948/m.12020 type:complete len:396 (+) Transcript_2948:1059-2246(+)